MGVLSEFWWKHVCVSLATCHQCHCLALRRREAMVLEVLHMEAARDGGVGQGVGRVGLVILSTDQARNTMELN